MTTNDTNDAKLIAIDPGRVAQSVAHLIHEPEVPGLIPPTSCLLPLIQEEHLSVTGEICARSAG